MKSTFSAGDQKQFCKIVTEDDVARFDESVVHEVYSTFSLARDAEWTTRQFVLEMKDEDEEGIGTFLTVDHKAPAFMGEEIIFTARVERLERNELICSYEAAVTGRLIATGKTGQKIFSKERLREIFSRRD